MSNTMADLLATNTAQAQMSSFFIDKMGLLSVKSYGATGDGVTNDTVAIQDCIAVATAQGLGSIFFPHGVYAVTAGLASELASFILWGDNSTITGDTVTINQIGSPITLTNKNYLINSAFDVWQRGTSFISPESDDFTADRFCITQDTDNDSTVTRASAIESGQDYSLRVEANADKSDGSDIATWVSQSIENYNDFEGRVVCSSVRLKVDSGVSYYIIIDEGPSQTSTATKVGTGAIETISIVHTVTSSVSKLKLSVVLLRNDITSGEGLNIQWMKLETGSTLTEYVKNPYSEELRDCLRYYWKLTDDTIIPIGIGVAASTTVAKISVNSFVPMRTSPTLTVTDLGSGTIALQGNGSSIDVSSASFSPGMIDEGGLIFITVTTSGLTQYEVYTLSIDDYSIEFDAEL